MKENAPEKSRANVLIILGHFQKWLTQLFILFHCSVSSYHHNSTNTIAKVRRRNDSLLAFF